MNWKKPELHCSLQGMWSRTAQPRVACVCASAASTQVWRPFAQAVTVQFLFSATHVLSAKEWRVVCASHSQILSADQDCFCSLIQAAFCLRPLFFSMLFPQELSILPSPSISCWLNPFLARHEASCSVLCWEFLKMKRSSFPTTTSCISFSYQGVYPMIFWLILCHLNDHTGFGVRAFLSPWNHFNSKVHHFQSFLPHIT